MIASALVVGQDGLIGQALVECLRLGGVDVWGTSRRQHLVTGRTLFLDLASSTVQFPFPRVETVFICGAMSRFADCDVDPEMARRVNVTAPVELARVAIDQGARVVFLSSNAVFDGTLQTPLEDSLLSPATQYGHLKAEAEVALQGVAAKYGGQVSILRLTKVVSAQVPLFSNWLRSLRNGETVEAIENLTLSPVFLADATRAIISVGTGLQGGVFHFSGSEEYSYADFARRMAIGCGGSAPQVMSRHREGDDGGSRHNRLSMGPQSLRATGMAPQKLDDVIRKLCKEQ